MPSLRRTAFAAATAVLVGVAVGTPAAPVSAATPEEVYAVPAGGSLAVDGHGWGHGHGMSQWGAQGAASLGSSADQITSFYYPGTAKTSLPNALIRVLLQADTGSDTTVYPASGLTVTDLATGTAATLPGGPTRWRSVADSAGLHVQQLVGGTWKPYALGGKTVHAGPVQFGGPATVRVAFPDGTSRDYRGAVRSVRTTSTTVGTVNVVAMESYLLGVVPRESSSSWAAAALQAQAIAARSYSAYKRAHAPSSQFFDICDTTQCQVYGGAALYSSSGARTPLEATSTSDAVSATAGVIRTYQGSAIFAEFSSSNGGWSTDGGLPYLVAQRDDWDGAVSNGVHTWTASLTTSQIEQRFPSVGTLLRLRVTSRDGNGEWGGRVKAVVLEGVDSTGAATSVSTTGAGIYNAHSWPASSDGLRSSWWHIRDALSSAVAGQSAAPRLVQSPGVSTGTLTVSMRNTGTSSWAAGGLHLAVASPPGQADPLVGNSTTPGVYTGSAATIAPGELATFGFSLTGDGVKPGLQGRSYRLRSGSGALFGATVSLAVQVDAPAFTAVPEGAPVAIGATPSNAPADSPGVVFSDGRTVVVPVAGSTGLRLSVRNTGNLSWPAGSAPVRLGTSAPRGGTSPSAGSDWLDPPRPSGLTSPDAVAPGQSGTFTLTLYGNSRPVGVTTESFEPLWEARHWIDGAATGLTVVRVDPARSRVATTDRALPSSVALTNAPSGTALLTVRLRNVGGSPWVVGQEALGADQTPLSTSAWPASTTASALSANISRPGQAKVYPGEVGEWQVPVSAYRRAAGTYGLAFQPRGPDGAAYGPRLVTKVTVTKAVFRGTVTRQSGRLTVPRRGTVQAFFEVRNTGNVAWPVGGPVRSAALAPGSPSRGPGWISAVRPGSLSLNLSRRGATSVRPGEIGRFLVVLAGNGRAPRSASEPFGVVWETWARVGGVQPVLAYRVA